MNLYHYCSTDKCFNILKSQTIRMSDISKSNDAAELELMFPDLLHVVLKKYLANPFPFKLFERFDEDAMQELINDSELYWQDRFVNGSFSNFVLCFSEEKDSLSQWRGYAHDGQGCCIGFSKDVIQRFCDSSNGVLLFKKVEYVTQNQIESKIDNLANEILQLLRTLRQWIVKHITGNDNSPDTDHLLEFNFIGALAKIFTESLSLKSRYFSEEREWRLFLANQAYKEPDWVIDKTATLIGPNQFDETLNFLNNKIEFNWTDNDLIPFFPLKFDEFSKMPITEILLGPKSKIRISDMKLFLQKYGYPKVDIQASVITYR